jgi:hypothetical protein
MTEEKKVRCPWCIQSNFICKGIPDCDFKSLPKEKDAILRRVKEEVVVFNSLKEELVSHTFRLVPVESRKKVVGGLWDKIFGIAIMCDALKNEFGMSKEEVLEQTGYKKLDKSEQWMLAMEIKKLERAS